MLLFLMGDCPLTAVSDRSRDIEAAIGARLRDVLKGSKYSDLAKRSGVSSRTLSRYVAGEAPKLSALVAIADAFDLSLDWLATGRGSRLVGDPSVSTVDDRQSDATLSSQNVSGSGKSRYVALPRYNIAASAGHGALAEHSQVVEYIAFDVDFVRTRLRRDPKHLVLIEARGDSMEPTIRDGDILTVDITPDQALQSSTLYVIRIEEALMVKRLDRRIDGSIVVHSDNSRYPPETVSRESREQLHILGQVIFVSAPPR